MSNLSEDWKDLKNWRVVNYKTQRHKFCTDQNLLCFSEFGSRFWLKILSRGNTIDIENCGEKRNLTRSNRKEKYGINSITGYMLHCVIPEC